MKKEKIAFVFATYTLSDPTTRNTINSISNLFDKIIVVEQNSSIKYKPLESKNIVVEQVSDLSGFPGLMGIKNVFKWITYKLTVKKLIKKYNPGLLITFMLKPLAAIKLLPGQIMISCIYDIPDPQTAGKMDGVINKRGFLNLKNAQVVWASDEYKAALTAEFGKLNTLPLVCYNCPVLKTDDYDVASAKLWLREKLRQSGATVSETGGTVLVRAGAIGPYGGIEETLSAMTALPENCIFLMMGRPDKEYGEKLVSLVKDKGLEERAIFWNRPDDETWQKAIAGADIGHLLHLPPPENTIQAGAYKYNSSLSNYRIFTYMAAGIPILSYNDIRLKNLHEEMNCFCELNIKDIENEIRINWEELNKNNVLRNKMGSAALEAFRTKYNWEYQFNEINKIITHSQSSQQ